MRSACQKQIIVLVKSRTAVQMKTLALGELSNPRNTIKGHILKMRWQVKNSKKNIGSKVQMHIRLLNDKFYYEG